MIWRLAFVSTIYWIIVLGLLGLVPVFLRDCTANATYDECMRCLADRGKLMPMGLTAGQIGFPVTLAISELIRWLRSR